MKRIRTGQQYLKGSARTWSVAAMPQKEIGSGHVEQLL
jgi:hypothetical protein